MENKSTRKMKLTEYLARRRPTNALTGLEADVFGVPFPLVGGWAKRHGEIEITVAMLEELRVRIGGASTSTTKKAKNGLDAVLGAPKPTQVQRATSHLVAPAAKPRMLPAAFRGFALRGAIAQYDFVKKN